MKQKLEAAMGKIKNKGITVTRHSADGFTLSYLNYEGVYYHKRYTGYGIRDAKARFKEYVYEEDAKIFRCMTRDDVLLDALQGICGGSRTAARELLGNT
jgi:hypothetical protein